MTPQELVDILAAYDYHFGSETELHACIECALVGEDIEFEREHRLDARNRIDFYIPDSRLGVEVKVEGQALAVARQLLRYASSPTIAGLVLLTTRRQHRGTIPHELGGKPIAIGILGGIA